MEKDLLGIRLDLLLGQMHEAGHDVEAQQQIRDGDQQRQHEARIDQRQHADAAGPAGVQLVVTGKTPVGQGRGEQRRHRQHERQADRHKVTEKARHLLRRHAILLDRRRIPPKLTISVRPIVANRKTRSNSRKTYLCSVKTMGALYEMRAYLASAQMGHLLSWGDPTKPKSEQYSPPKPEDPWCMRIVSTPRERAACTGTASPQRDTGGRRRGSRRSGSLRRACRQEKLPEADRQESQDVHQVLPTLIPCAGTGTGWEGRPSATAASAKTVAAPDSSGAVRCHRTRPPWHGDSRIRESPPWCRPSSP